MNSYFHIDELLLTPQLTIAKVLVELNIKTNSHILFIISTNNSNESLATCLVFVISKDKVSSFLGFYLSKTIMS